ncbi:hypothetical protein PIB30_090223, partial [Stylosanthes scabra]|nr:hypothetical protein [Stylosanthes scabra]
HNSPKSSGPAHLENKSPAELDLTRLVRQVSTRLVRQVAIRLVRQVAIRLVSSEPTCKTSLCPTHLEDLATIRLVGEVVHIVTQQHPTSALSSPMTDSRANVPTCGEHGRELQPTWSS